MAHWMQHVVEFGIGFFQGVAQSRAERHATNNRLTFADAMIFLGRETGYRVEILDANSAVFEVAYRGEMRSVIVVEKGSSIAILVMSNITFQPGGAPSDVCQVLRQQNQQLPTCDFDLYSGRTGDQFMVRTSVRCEDLSPEIFEAALKELVPRVEVLDRVLIKNGYR